jgi:hypothetical protein
MPCTVPRTKQELQKYIGTSKIVAFDFKTSPDDKYRAENLDW